MPKGKRRISATFGNPAFKKGPIRHSLCPSLEPDSQGDDCQGNKIHSFDKHSQTKPLVVLFAFFHQLSIPSIAIPTYSSLFNRGVSEGFAFRVPHSASDSVVPSRATSWTSPSAAGAPVSDPASTCKSNETAPNRRSALRNTTNLNRNKLNQGKSR